MRRTFMLPTVTALGLSFLAGCAAVDGLQNRASTAETCEATVEILADMSEITLLIATNPFGYDTYASELESLAAELEALEPRDPELNEALSDLGKQINFVVTGINDDEASFDTVAGAVAEAQLAFRDISNLCEATLSEQ